eukprot:15710818-Heterocapsa_arctica.AAC.1
MKRRPEMENAWPEYKDSVVLVSKPTYLTARDPPAPADSEGACARIGPASPHLTNVQPPVNSVALPCGQAWLQ